MDGANFNCCEFDCKQKNYNNVNDCYWHGGTPYCLDNADESNNKCLSECSKKK